MKKSFLKKSFFSSRTSQYIFYAWAVLFFLTAIVVQDAYAPPPPPPAPTYTISAHGNTSYGVNRSSIAAFGYSIGNCAHCHEQHASIGGAEPDPSEDIARRYLLFRDIFDRQGSMFCYSCHGAGDSPVQDLGNQWNYSRMAGGDSSIVCPGNIREAFRFLDNTGVPRFNCSSSTGSSHFLYDIQIFLTSRWNFGSVTGRINPCSGCHNPHSAQRDPHTTVGRLTGGILVSSVSRPSQHSKDNNIWELWGDDSDERMSSYNYQPPYRYNSTVAYEPDGGTSDAERTVDYIVFCTDCHNTSNTISSSPLVRNLRSIYWAAEKHGQGSADGSIDIQGPYSPTTGYVLSCLDCHEPHGAPNVMLVRQEVNGGSLSTITTVTPPVGACTPRFPEGSKELGYLCNRCHKDDYDAGTGSANQWEYVHHLSADAPYSPPSSCGTCHSVESMTRLPINCNCCHFHGSDDSAAPAGWRTNRRTF